MPGAEVGLARGLSLFDLTMIGVGAMIGAGVFVLTGIGAGVAGPALMLAFALNGVVTLFTAMVYAELGSAIPEAGGGYLWVQEALGNLQSFTAGWMSWFAHAVAGALYAIAFGSFGWELLRVWVGEVPLSHAWMGKLIGVAVVFLFTYINYRGSSETGKAGNIVTGIKIAIILFFIGAGVFTLWQHPTRMASFEPFFPQGLDAVVIAMGLTFIAFEGYEIIAQAGEEVVKPKENVPKAIFWSLLVVVPIYVMVAFTAIGAIMPQNGLATWEFLGQAGELGLLEAAKDFMPFGFTLLLLGGLVSTMSALNATTFSSTRVAFAMGRDRVLPKKVAEIHERTRVPVVALLLSMLIMLGMVLFVPIEGVAAAADIMFLLLFLQVNVTVIKIRRNRGEEIDYGFKIPWFPVIPILAIILMAGLAVFLFFYEPIAWFIAIGWIIAGLIVFYTYSKDYKERQKLPSEVVFEQRPTEDEGYSVLVPISNPQTLPHLVETAVAIAEDRDGSIQFLTLVEVPHQLPLEEGKQYVGQRRELLEEAERLVDDRVPVRSAVRVGHDIPRDIVFSVRDFGSDMVLLGWRAVQTRSQGVGRLVPPVETLFRDTMQHVVEKAPCDVVVLNKGLERGADSVAVPIRGNRHAPLALRVGHAMAAAHGTTVRAFHLLPEAAGQDDVDDAGTMLAKVVNDAGLADADVTFSVERAPSVFVRLAEEAGPRSVLVLGASERPWYRQHLFGETPERIVREASGTVLLVRRYEGYAVSKLREMAGDFWRFLRRARNGEDKGNLQDAPGAGEEPAGTERAP